GCKHGWEAPRPGPGYGRQTLMRLDQGLTSPASGVWLMTDTTHDQIQAMVAANEVVLFMKGTAGQPMCGFSNQVVQILDHLGVPLRDVNVLADPAIRQGIKDFSNWPTIPQLYVKGEFIGGCDIVREMFQTGELKALFADKGVAVDA